MLLIVFRLEDPYGNKESLGVSMRTDGSLNYSLYGGWQDSGTPYAISNLLLKESLPISVREFKGNQGLFAQRLRNVIRTGVVKVIKTEVVNEIGKEKEAEYKSSMKVEIGKDFISVTEGKNEIVYWHEDEWKEDPSIITSIANAIKMAYTNPKELKKKLGK